MEYGGNNGPEFNWNYIMPTGGVQVSPQQMNPMSQGGYSGGQQWMHSNQGGGGQNYQQSMPQGQNMSSPNNFEDYNQSMMRYINLGKVDVKSDTYGTIVQQGPTMGMNPMGNSYGGYPQTMTRNGLGNPGPSMGHGSGSGGYGGNW